jgi:hypothetical protein
MSKISTSSERHTFQENNYLKDCEAKGKEPREDYLNLFKTYRQQDEENMSNPEWQKNNLEYDLRSTDWILEKARSRDDYAQNVYAAMCNMRWQRLDVFPILKEEYWSCSWRSAGGIVADMLQKGDYIDWYCSGMGGLVDYDPEEGDKLMSEKKYVPEGTVTNEIREDFKKLGWIPSEWPEDE